MPCANALPRRTHAVRAVWLRQRSRNWFRQNKRGKIVLPIDHNLCPSFQIELNLSVIWKQANVCLCPVPFYKQQFYKNLYMWWCIWWLANKLLWKGWIRENHVSIRYEDVIFVLVCFLCNTFMRTLLRGSTGSPSFARVLHGTYDLRKIVFPFLNVPYN